MRVVTTKESTYVGRCIYCGETRGKLTEEHISPFALNGLITLLAASCSECNKATSRIEEYVLRRMWGAARAEMGYRTRHKKGGSDLYPLTVIQDGTKTVREVPLKDALKIIELPIFRLPAILDGRAFAGNIECISKDQFVLVEQREDLAKRLGVDEVCAPDCNPDYSHALLQSVPMGTRLNGMELRHSIPSMSAQQSSGEQEILDDGLDRQTHANSQSARRQCRADSESSQWTALIDFLGLSGSPQEAASGTQPTAGDVEGIDNSQSSGWGDYPLDSVFVRTAQRTVAEVVKRINANRYDLNPEFQRDFVWQVEAVSSD